MARKGKAKKGVSGLADDVLQTGAGLLSQKMRYDYEKTLSKEEREQRYQDRKKVGTAVAICLGLVIVTVVVVNTNK